MKNFKPLISVIMNCCNGEKYLKKSIISVLNQSYSNWELIFWDNLSKDQSYNIVKSFIDPRIRCYKSKNFLNLYSARNQAIQKAKGEYISFLDVDDWWVKHKLLKQVNLLRKNLKIKFIYSNFYIYNQDKKKRIINSSNTLPTGFITQELLNDYKIGILTVLIKKSVLVNKKFDSSYNIIGDFDCFLKLSLSNEFFYIKEPLAYYRIHDGNFSQNYKVYYEEFYRWLQKNEIRYKKLCFSLKKIKFFIIKLRVKILLGSLFIGRALR